MLRRAALMILTGMVLASCSGGPGRFVGKWESTFGGVSMELKADNSAQFTVVGIQRDGTWEMTGKNQIVVHGGRDDLNLTLDEEGNLSGQGGTFVKQK